MFDFFYKKPSLLYSIIAAFFILGVAGLFVLPKNLFPDANPPTIVILTKAPGVTAQVAASTISKPIEEEVARLGLVTDVSSVNVANFSIVTVEFGYKKSLSAAAVDVSNAIAVAKAKLPTNVKPAVYEVGDFTLPVDVISLSPKNDHITLADIRKVADSFIKPELLSDKRIGNVEVFGGYESAIEIEVDPFKAKKYGVNFEQLTKALHTLNHDMPIGFMKGKNNFYTVTFYGERDNIQRLKQLLIAPNIRLDDIATVQWGYQKRTSGYIGNGKQAIALAIERSPGGSVLDVSNAAREDMKLLAQKYPNIEFQISDTQRNLVEQSNKNMLEALRDSIILTLIVLLFFLGNFRAIIAAGVSIPLVFFATIAIIWLMGGSLNIIIYTAIILSMGMLTDDAVVVLENIERHMKDGAESLEEAIKNGTKEVIMPIFGGTVATISILFPLMFIGGFPQQIFRPLIETLILSLIVSYFLSITFIPLLSRRLYKNGNKKTKVEHLLEKAYQNSVGKFVYPYLAVIKFSNGKRFRIPRRMLLIGGVMMLTILSMKNIMPVIGKDSMPPMDTGIIKVKMAFSSNLTVNTAEKRLEPFLQWLHQQKWVKQSSIAFGSEAGVLSLGSGNLPSEASMTIIATDRFKRKKTIWQLENEIRAHIAQLEGVKRDDVFDFGATPVSSVKATVVERLLSPTLAGLSTTADKVREALKNISGLTSVSKSWGKDFTEIELDINENKALSYGLTPYAIAMQIPIRGEVVELNSNLSSMKKQFVRVYLKGKFSQNIQTLRLLPIQTKMGEIPLEEFATFKKHRTYAKIERDNMLYSLDVNGYRSTKPTTLLTDDAIAAIKKAGIHDVKIQQAGSIELINDSFKRMLTAVGFGFALLLLTLTAVYGSLRLSLVTIAVLPISLLGASWAMLLFGKPSCLPSMLGILLLFSIVVKNAVLLIDFYITYRKRGEAPYESAIEAIKVRFRPIMMTSFGTIAGMLPIALELAVGLERLSPLADVAIGGLLTLLTPVYIPLYAYITDRGDKKSLKAKEQSNKETEATQEE